jgi:hypothetical protein
MISFPFSSLSKRPGATLAGVFSLALGCVLLLCGAGSVPVENLLPQGAMQGDLNAGGHNLTNAATVSATNVVVSGSLTAPASFTLPFSRLTSTPTTLSGYGITDAEAALGNPGADGYVLSSTALGVRSWIAPGGGGSLALDSNTAGVLTLTSGVLAFSVAPNTTGGLALLGSDGSIAFLGTTDTEQSSVAIGLSSHATGGGFALGTHASGLNGSVAIGPCASGTNGGGATGNYASVVTGGSCGYYATATSGGAIGYGAFESGGGFAGGSTANATSGAALGNGTTETGGGANFCGGSYAGTGIAINADEIAVWNGSGHATITGQLARSKALLTAQTGSVASVAAYTPTAGVPTIIEIGVTVTITTLTTDSIQVQVSYTDENGNAQTVNVGAPVATAGVTPISPIDIMTDGVSPITIITTDTGLGTSVYDVSGRITQP